MRELPILLLTLLLSACASTSSLTGDAVPAGVLTALDDGRADEAATILRNASPEDRERAYPALFTAARERYEGGAYADSLDVLRLLVTEYPEAGAVQEAYVYGLFLERAGQKKPDPDLVEELEEGVAELSASSVRVPHWVALVEAQTAIDQGQTAEASVAFQRFRSAWDGQPAALQPYVDDLGRYLASH